jgi:hypothetical protein
VPPGLPEKVLGRVGERVPSKVQLSQGLINLEGLREVLRAECVNIYKNVRPRKRSSRQWCILCQHTIGLGPAPEHTDTVMIVSSPFLAVRMPLAPPMSLKLRFGLVTVVLTLRASEICCAPVR